MGHKTMTDKIRAKIECESSSNYKQETIVNGDVINSDSVLMQILADDGYRYTVENASNGNDKILVMHDSGRSAVKGVVTSISTELR